MRKPLAIVALAALTISLAGCTIAVPKAAAPSDDKKSVQVKPTQTDDPTDSSVDDSNAKKRNSLKFGDTYSYTTNLDDSPFLDITVTNLRPYTPSEYAAGATYPTAVVMDVSVTNTSNDAIELFPQVKSVSGGQPGSSVFDSGTGLVDPPTGTLLTPGQTLAWNEVQSVADPNSVQIQIAPTLDAALAIYSN